MRVRRHQKPLRPPRLGRISIPRPKVSGWIWVVVAAVAGYLVTVIWLYPEPLLGDNRVPRVLDLTREQAMATLSDAGLRGRFSGTEPHPSAPAGTVVWQDPPPATDVPAGTVIQLVASEGPPLIPLPDVVGLDVLLAGEILRSAGFEIGSVDSIAALSDLGSVVATRPVAGSPRSPGTRITLVVSQGPAVIEIPNVVGLSYREAYDVLDQAGLRIGRVRERRLADVAPGLVIEQRPAPGIRSPLEGKVDLTFSREPR